MSILNYTLQELDDYLDEQHTWTAYKLVDKVKEIIEDYGDLPLDIQLKSASRDTTCILETVEEPRCSVALFGWSFNSMQLKYGNKVQEALGTTQASLKEAIGKAIEIVYLCQIDEAIQSIRTGRLSEHYDYLSKRFGISKKVFELGEWTTLGSTLNAEELYELIKYIKDNEDDIPYRVYKTLGILYRKVFNAVEADNKAEGG